MPPYAYVAAFGDDALTIIDLANLLAPAFTGSIQGAGAPPWLGAPYRVKVVGDYAYVSAQGDDSLTIIDVSNPLAPAFVSSIRAVGTLFAPRGLDVVGNYAYIATFDSLTIVDISNPLVPVLAGSIAGGGAPPWLGGTEKVHVVGNYAYHASGGDSALTIIDVTNPLAPVFAGSIQGAGFPNFLGGALGVYKVGDYAYVASFVDNALSIFNVANPLAPVLAGSIQGGANFLTGALDVYVVGNYAYVAAWGDNALTIIDVTNPAVPVFAGSIQGALNFLTGARGVHIDGNYAYVAASGDNALTVIDVANPLAPAFVGSIQGPGAPNWLQTAFHAFLKALVAPTVATDPATAVVSNSASLNGTLSDDGGEACVCGFEWGATPAYGNTTPTQSRITGQTFLYSIGPLSPDTTYYFRAFATNSMGTSYGIQRSFTTLQVPYYSSLILPRVQTNPATLITEHTARLNGEVVEDGGVMGDTRFQWGLTTEYGNITPWQQGYGKGDSFFANLSSLAEGQAFHFRAQFRVGGKVVNGADASFSTLSPLGPVTLIEDELIYLLGVA